ncbi:MAG: hypothetical protein JWM95_454 [Gemmatimonadetes bacterium]|nr:hypothetical protein [Gemmatimonadota bacterium]
MKQRAAFTLLELMIVLVILAITAGAAVPAYLSRQPGTRERQAAGDVVELLMRARAFAREHGVTASFTLSPADGKYWLVTHDSLGAGTVVLPSGVRFGEALPSRMECRFEPAGMATPCSIRIRGVRTVVVRVNEWSGEIRVDDDQQR